MRLLFKIRNEVLREPSAERKDGAARCTNDDVRANSARPADLILQQAAADAYQSEDHGDLNADGDGAQEGPDGPVPQILENEFVDHLPMGAEALVRTNCSYILVDACGAA